ncbi:hypothetical protein [Tenacibaculum amylolyticum]|uniref:hypothetical protein n=1 Tax=Tenacibaculum amylolyticum TaxID=104269 RepID=UPI0038950AF4
MIDLKKISISIFLSFTFFLVVAQEEKLPSYFSNTSLNLEKSTYLEQIQNIGFKSANSQDGVISLQQIGDSNNAAIQNRFAIGFHNVRQIGNSNLYQFQNYNNNLSINLGILQLRDNNYLKIIGSNTLSNNMSIVQFGGARMEILNY